MQSLVQIPAKFLRPRHVYRVTAEVIAGEPGSENSRQGSATTLLHTRELFIEPSVTANTVHTEGETAPSSVNDTDLVVMNFASDSIIDLSGHFTKNLDLFDRDAELVYEWNCRKWLSDTVDYWSYDADIVTPSTAGISDCFFNETGALPCCDRKAIRVRGNELSHQTVHEFSFKVSVQRPTAPGTPFTAMGYLRLQVIRTDSDDFAVLKTGRAVLVRLAVGGSSGKSRMKILPGDLSLVASLDPVSFNEGFDTGGEGCRPSPVEPFGPGCRVVFDEMGFGLDLSNTNVTMSATDIGFSGFPGIYVMTIKKPLVAPGARFVFRATLYSVRIVGNSETWVTRGSNDIMIEVNSPPRCGTIQVSPGRGDAFVTDFELSGLQWEDDPEDLPLQYAFATEMGDSQDLTYLTEFRDVESITTILSMTKDVAASSPCEGQDLSQPSMCSFVTVHVFVRDLHGAEESAKTQVAVTITPRSQTLETVEGLYYRALAAAFQGRNIPAMLALLGHLSLMLLDPVTEANVNEGNRLDSTRKSFPDYQEAIVVALGEAFEFGDGKLVPNTPIIASMTASTVQRSISQLSKITPELIGKMMSLTTAAARGLKEAAISGRLPGGTGPSDAVVLSMLGALSELSRKLLSQYGIFGTNRRLMSQNDDVTTAYEATNSGFESLCVAVLAAEAAGSTRFFTNQPGANTGHIFHRAGAATEAFNVSFAFPAADPCQAMNVKIRDMVTTEDLYICATTWQYDPVAYAGVKSGNDALTGAEQHSLGLPWPLAARVCPVTIKVINRAGEEITPPVEFIELDYELPSDQVRMSVPEPDRAYTSLVYRDRMFSAACEEFVFDSTAGRAAPGGWFLNQHQTHILDSDNDAMCNATHFDQSFYSSAPEVASGHVQCVMKPTIPTGTRMPSRLYGVLLERTDCSGAVDTMDKRVGGWRDGQFAFYTGGAPSPRRVCDRCKKCGGLNQCSLSCSNEISSEQPALLDLCGVCGGYCTTAAGCTVAQCTPLYLRYLGSGFPADLDISADGLTAGKFFFPAGVSVPCPGPTPLNSPQGICTNIQVGALTGRMERYPFHSGEKTCWENSPVIPDGHPDKVCTFETEALKIRDTAIAVQRTLKIFAGTEDGQIFSAGDKLMRDLVGATFELNGTNPLADQRGTYLQLQPRLNLLRYEPLLNWNSKWPPERYRYIHFEFAGNPLKSRVEVTLKPVNDPPRIVASTTPYEVEEDRPTTLNEPFPVSIIDDADDVQNASITVTLGLYLEGSLIRFGTTANWTRTLSVEGRVVHVNEVLATLQYITPENSNALFNPEPDHIIVSVNDRGYGGIEPYNQPFTDTLKVNITSVLQNDRPFAVMANEIIVFQNEVRKFRGAHVVDPDYWQSPNLATKPPTYEADLSVAKGELATGLMRVNCSNAFSSSVEVPMTIDREAETAAYKFVDERLPNSDPVRAGCTMLKLDGREENEKRAYLGFETRDLLPDRVKDYPSLRTVFSIFKLDCYDAHADKGDAAEKGNAAKETQCQDGSFDIYAGDCDWERSSLYTYRDYQLDVKKPKEYLGTANTTGVNREWVQTPVDTEKLLAHLEENGGKICLQLVPVHVNETQRYSTWGKDYGRKTSWEENLTPKIAFLTGGAVNASKFDSNCTIKVLEGTGNVDQKLRFHTDIYTMNSVVEELQFASYGHYSNILGTNELHIVLGVKDVTPEVRAACLVSQARFGPSQCDVANIARTKVRVIPFKTGRVSFHMQPYYADRWVRAKSAAGETPVYVAFEDCGGRAWDEECPSKLQILPEIIDGEYPEGKFTIEITSKLGTITVPKAYRSQLEFSKGTGFRDSVVRFAGATPVMREALMSMEYHTRLDRSLQYKNQYSNEHPGTANLACSRVCFFNNIGPVAFLGEDEAAGCGPGCSARIAKRVNQDAPDELSENGIFLDDLVITFSDNGMSGIGSQKYTTLQMYNIYTVAVNDKPCIVFKGRISSGCRSACANPGMPNNCYTTGDDIDNLPLDLNNPFVTTMFEGQSEPILLGGMVAKIVDEYESSRIECRTQLSAALGNRGEDTVDPLWLEECPRLNVRISATNGYLALNSREYIEIYLGSESTFFSPIAFLGYAVDVNAAMRMVRYQVNPDNPYFNSNLGKEVVTISVTDQGFSGADSTGEFDGTTAESLLKFEVSIEPVNNLPIITIPRASDPIQVPQNGEAQLAREALEPGLKVTDVDSDECGGKITLILDVPYGRLYVAKARSSTIEKIPDMAVDNLDFFAVASCTEAQCERHLEQSECEFHYACAWSTQHIPEKCVCKKVSPGGKCSSLKIRGSQGYVQAALRSVVYVPPADTNYLSHPTPERLRVRVSDKADPEALAEDDFSCGLTLGDRIPWVENSAAIQTVPVSQPAIATNAPLVRNRGFELPQVCEGLFACTDFMAPDTCGGVIPQPPRSTFAWVVVSGKAGVSFSGWVGPPPLPYCCPYPCPYCTLTPSLPLRSETLAPTRAHSTCTSPRPSTLPLW